MSKTERRKFDESFKRMVVELHLNGKTSIAIGEELGIGADLVRRWTREFKLGGDGSFPGNGKQHLS